ncbi:hypothetical protein ANCCAN_30302, partial [Ancylostoma caninum]
MLGLYMTIFSPVIDPSLATSGNRLPAQTIRYGSNLTSDAFQKMEIKGPSLWESPPCTGVCFKWNDYDVMYEQTLKYCKVLLEDVEMLTMLNESKFELAYVESFDACAP